MKTKVMVPLYIGVSAASAFCTIQLSYLAGRILDSIVQGTVLSGWTSLVLSVAGVVLLYIVTGTLLNTLRTYLVGRQMTSLRDRLSQSILGMKRSEYFEQEPSYYHNLLYTDLEMLRDSYLKPKLLLLDAAILLLCAGGSIVSIHWSFLLIACIATFIPNLIPKVYATALQSRREQASEKTERFLQVVKESVLGMRVIRDFAIESEKEQEFGASSQAKLEAGTALAVTQNAITASFIFTGYFMYAFVLACGVFLYLHDWISIPEILIASQLTNTIKSPILSIIQNRSTIRSTASLRDKVGQILKRQPETDSGEVDAISEISISDLQFGFSEGKPVLQDVGLKLTAGKKYLLVGESGAGKSTLLRILDRQYPQYTGSILVDGSPLETIHPTAWHRRVAYLSQEVYLFEHSLAFNIALAPDVDEERLQRAIQKAHLATWVATLENGVQTVIKESATNLSGGEKKRIALARIFYHDPDWILLDEPFSSLDDANRRLLENELLSMKDKTILHVAHQQDEETRKRYDAVLVFRDRHADWEDSKTWGNGRTEG